MKRIAALFFVVALLPSASQADVRLERLEDFEVGRHRIGVNVYVDIEGECRQDAGALNRVFTEMLEQAGFQTGPLQDSDLEFAVSIIGFPTSAQMACGVRVLSMVRQVPERKILRLSPAAHSNRYRLWQTENIINGPKGELRTLLEKQARQDVTGFFWVCMRATKPAESADSSGP